MQFGEQPEKSLSETLAPFFAAFRRYWKIALGPALALLIIGIVVAVRLPNVYSATASILIQPQRINSKVFEEPSRNKDESRERLDALAQEILSRSRLRSVIERFGVYPELTGVKGAEKALIKFRKNIDIAPVQSTTGGLASQIFQLSFEHSDPKVAFEVTQALTNLFIEESIVDQRSEAQGAEEFFDSQLSDARRKLEELEKRRQEFVESNFGQLPEQLQQSMTLLQTLNSQLDTNAQLMSAHMTRRQNLEQILQDVKKLAPTGGNNLSGDPQERLAQLEQALVILKSRYSEQHPDVIKTRNQIAAMKTEIAKGASSASTTSGSTTSAQTIAVRREINEVEVQLKTLKEDTARLKEKIGILEANIREMPAREQELLKINRDYDTTKARYDRLLAAREQAGLQTSLIRSQKGQQFRLIDKAEMPRIPTGPYRILIGLGGLVLALGCFVAIPIALYLFNGSYRVKDDLEYDLGVSVLGVIPPMVTPESVGFSRRQSLTSLLVSAASAAVVSVVIYVVV